MAANDNTVSFNALLQQALTFGVKRVTPSALPQFIGFVVYTGLVGAIWTGISLRLDQRIIAAGIVLLLVAAIMTLLLLLGASISPIVLNALVIIVVIGFLGVGGYAVVKTVAPDQIELRANLEYANGPSAGNFTVRLEGHQTGVPTAPNGYFELPILSQDIRGSKIRLHIESPDGRYARDKSIPVNPGITTMTTVVLDDLQSPASPLQPAPVEGSTRVGDLPDQNMAAIALANQKEAKFQFSLAGQYAKAGNGERALEALQQAARLDPTDIGSHKCLAVAYVSTSLDFDNAIAEYKLARDAPGAKPDLDDRLSLVIANKDPVQKALQQLTLRPGDVEAHMDLARILGKLTVLGTYERMNKECEKAIALAVDPGKRNFVALDCALMGKSPLIDNHANQDCPLQ